MKQNKLRKLAKTAQKKISKNIEQRLITELKTVSGTLGTGSEKLEKRIVKGSKQLAKKLSKEILIDKSALIAAHQEAKAAKVPASTNAQ